MTPWLDQERLPRPVLLPAWAHLLDPLLIVQEVQMSWVVPRTRLIKGKQQRHVPIIHFERFELKIYKIENDNSK